MVLLLSDTDLTAPAHQIAKTELKRLKTVSTRELEGLERPNDRSQRMLAAVVF